MKNKSSHLSQQIVEKHLEHSHLHLEHSHLLLLYHVLPYLTVYDMVFFSYNLLHNVMQLDFVFEKHNSSRLMKKDVVTLLKRQCEFSYYIVYVMLPSGVVPWYTSHIATNLISDHIYSHSGVSFRRLSRWSHCK